MQAIEISTVNESVIYVFWVILEIADALLRLQNMLHEILEC